MGKRAVTLDEAKRVGDQLGIDWTRLDFDQFRIGMEVEFEHGSADPVTDATNDDPILTGKIALAHLNEFSDYYTRLLKMEADAEAEHTLP